MRGSDDPAEVEAAQKIAVFWPNQDGRGVHVNVSGGGVTKSAQHRDNAVKLLEFLVSDEEQKIRSEERRGGKECVSTCRCRWSPYHYNKKKNKENTKQTTEATVTRKN